MRSRTRLVWIPAFMALSLLAGCGWFQSSPVTQDTEEEGDGVEMDGLDAEGPETDGTDVSDAGDVPTDGEEETTGECATSSDCSDGDPCNGQETCDTDSGTCRAGTPLGDGAVCGDNPRSICLDEVCSESQCGDGFVDTGAGESCEPPGEDECSEDCRLGCSVDEDCPDDGNACNGEEFCDTGDGRCSSRNPLTDGTECGSDPRRICLDATCQNSICGDGYADAGASPAEECDDGNDVDGDGCDGGCLFSCHDDEECDDALPCTDDSCDAAGTHTCSHDAAASGTTCRSAAGACDVEEQCDGVTTACPADTFLDSSQVCRTTAGICDVEERCTGASALCPSDAFQPTTSECRAAAGLCDAAERCTGTSASCPADAYQPSSYLCRAAAGLCDVEEQCTGTATTCPADAFRPSSYTCRAAAGPCDVEERCSGSSAACPGDVFLTSSTVCRSSAGPCDAEERCTGSSAACPGDVFLPSSTVCRSSTGQCDAEERCTGTTTACPSDAFEPEGTPCSDGDPCTSPDQCDAAGECTGALGALSDIVWITTGFDYSCALLASGDIACWGRNNVGQLGDGTLTDSSVPVYVVGLSSPAVQVMAGGGSGGGHTCALLDTGGLQCWGLNDYGQIGDGTTTSRTAPTNVSGLTSGVALVSTGYSHTCALLNTNGVKCWGQNFDGRVGDGTTTDRSSPVDVVGLTSGVALVDAGGVHSCALLASGGMRCWGRNTDGQLGDGTMTQRTSPVDVTGLPSGITAIALGGFHTCALTSGGQALCWGQNTDGQVGNGTTTDQLTPVTVSGLATGAASVQGSRYFSCARTTGGSEKCWGDNTFSQLGDGTTTDRSVPVDVLGLPSTVVEISDGYNYTHACALLDDTTVACWGDNTYGQLGDGTTTDRLSPVSVMCN